MSPHPSVAVLCGLLLAAPAFAQAPDHPTETQEPAAPAPNPGPAADRPIDPETSVRLPREASGSAWQPDSTPIYGLHYRARAWRLMLHFNAFGTYDAQTTPRGGHRFFSTHWLMVMAQRRMQGGDFAARVMLTAEPLTVGPCGYPLLLQSGETYRNQPLVDAQHPHSLFMELALSYKHLVSDDVGVAFYVAPAGEPALGPPSFPQRITGLFDPAAPLGHHRQDSTHVSFGVFTGGVYSKLWKLEASWFNGREPGENRWGLQFASLDSLSARLSVNPTADLSAQVSYGYLRSPQALQPGAVHRVTASVMHNRPLGGGGNWATTLVWGRNAREQGATDSFLLESALELGEQHVLFGRAEYLLKGAEELAQQPDTPVVAYPLAHLTLGYLFQLQPAGQLRVGLGVRGTVNVVSDELVPVYRGRFPLGGMVFLRLGLAEAPVKMGGHAR
jgi:hypothetical protein